MNLPEILTLAGIAICVIVLCFLPSNNEDSDE